MRGAKRSSGEPRDGRGRRRALALGVLLGLLGGLAVWLALSGGGSGTGGSATACAGVGAAGVRQISPGAEGPLREAVARVLPGRVGRLYEEGTVSSQDVWRDSDPSPPAVSRTARRPAGYEMRWWAPNNDDIVADVFVFSSQARAAAFLAQAASMRCRSHGRTVAAADPPQGRNLVWVNPDAVAEADVYLQRGTRVYRVADVPAGQGAPSTAGAGLSHALLTIDTLACLLPKAHCGGGGSHVVPA
jgi:hypothetical protein